LGLLFVDHVGHLQQLSLKADYGGD
jgi:hypothetical protein